MKLITRPTVRSAVLFQQESALLVRCNRTSRSRLFSVAPWVSWESFLWVLELKLWHHLLINSVLIVSAGSFCEQQCNNTRWNGWAPSLLAVKHIQTCASAYVPDLGRGEIRRELGDVNHLRSVGELLEDPESHGQLLFGVSIGFALLELRRDRRRASSGIRWGEKILGREKFCHVMSVKKRGIKTRHTWERRRLLL